jgi:hypothetical protein
MAHDSKNPMDLGKPAAIPSESKQLHCPAQMPPSQQHFDTQVFAKMLAARTFFWHAENAITDPKCCPHLS